MRDERWDEIVGMIKDSFDVKEHKTEELDDEPGKVESIVFQGPLGDMKLERTVKPKVDDIKTIGSRRIGGDISVQKVYSESVNVDIFKAYALQNGEWVEVEAGDQFKID